ncbi:MAG: hypothetical protein ABEJ66_02975, partial [Candidatus Nanohaloarchaea archaeon]
ETQTVQLTASSSKPVEKNFNVVAASKTSYAQDIQTVNFKAVTCYASQLSATPTTQDVAALTEASYKITVRNTGTKADTFTLSTTRGELDETQLDIPGGETESTTLTYTPESLGTQTITVTAEGNSKSSAQVVADVYNGMNMKVSFDEQSRSACEKGTASYTVTVKNTGKAEETYRLQTSTGTLSDTEIELGTGESEQVEVTVNATKFKVGSSRTVRVNAIADTFDSPEKTATSKFSVQNCWDLKMNVVPKVASAGENRSVVYEIHITNTGTKENTYHVTHDGPSWISIKPDDLTIEPGKKETAFMYAGIPFEKEGRVKIEVTAEGTHVRRSQTVRLVIGEDLKDAIRSDRNALTGSFGKIASRLSGAVT